MRPVSTSVVSRAALAARRGLVVLVVAFGLVVMHGGVGQAQACVGAMSGMPTPTSPTLMSEHSHDDTAVDVEDPSGKPTKSPASAHSSDLCSSTPAASGGAGPDTAPALTATSFVLVPCIDLEPGAVSDVTGRHPPPPDLVTELCVNRR
jgi:hypothetical protein